VTLGLQSHIPGSLSEWLAKSQVLDVCSGKKLGCGAICHGRERSAQPQCFKSRSFERESTGMTVPSGISQGAEEGTGGD
jgi:hypothetical protein